MRVAEAMARHNEKAAREAALAAFAAITATVKEPEADWSPPTAEPEPPSPTSPAPHSPSIAPFSPTSVAPNYSVPLSPTIEASPEYPSPTGRERQILSELGSPLSETPTQPPPHEAQTLGRELFTSNRKDFVNKLQRIALLGEQHRQSEDAKTLADDDDSESPIVTETSDNDTAESDSAVSELDLKDEHQVGINPTASEEDKETAVVEWIHKTLKKFSQSDG